MKTVKLAGIVLISFMLVIAISFYIYTSFVDKLGISDEENDFIHPSKFLIKYEVFLSGTILRPAYSSFVNNLHLSGNERILDFGSGAGGEAIHLAERVQNKKGSLTCLDISKSWLEVVKYRLSKYTNIHYIEGDITQMNIRKNSFDVIILRLVLHDIPKTQRKSIIDTFYTILAPDGKIFVFEPISSEHSIDESEMRALFKNAHFNEKYFEREFSFVMIPPRQMVYAIYEKNN